MTRNNEVGFNRRVQLEWLEYTSELAGRGYAANEVSEALKRLLGDSMSVGGAGERNGGDKTVTILMRTWVNVPHHLGLLREDGLQLLQRLPLKDHLAVHWGMCTAVYPFWGQVAEVTGRLLRLQGVVTANLVQRRLRERMGERETVSDATSRVLRSFIDWEVLSETDRKGVYQAPPSEDVRDRQLAAWLVEAIFFARGGTSVPVDELVHSPALFPFNIEKSPLMFRTGSGRLEATRQGLNDEVLSRNTGH